MANKIEPLQIILTPEQTQALTDIAQEEGQSILEFVEKIIQTTIKQRQLLQRRRPAQQLEVLEQIRQHRAQILTARNGQPVMVDLVAILQKIREERDNELFHNIVYRN